MADAQKFTMPSVEQRHPLDCQHIELSIVFNFYFDQQESNTLWNALDVYSRYSPCLLDVTQFLLIDDCSLLTITPRDLGLNATWLRITTDVPWNQGGARNLGVTHAASDKVVVCDIDLIIPEKTLAHLIKRPNPGKHMFKFWRCGPDGKLMRPHSNVFYFSRSRFLKYFGYDEEFSGGYGAEDYRFVKFQKLQGTVFRKLPKRFFILNRETIDRQRSYHTLEREFERNTPIDNRKRNESIVFGSAAGHSRLFLSFTFEKIVAFRRQIPKPRLEKWWRRVWLVRQLRSYFCGSN